MCLYRKSILNDLEDDTSVFSLNESSSGIAVLHVTSQIAVTPHDPLLISFLSITFMNPNKDVLQVEIR